MNIALSGGELRNGEDSAPMLNAARRNDIHYVELWYPKNFECHGINATLRYFVQHNIQVAALATPTELGNVNDIAANQKLLVEAMELAHGIGCEIVGTYFGNRPKQDDDAAIEAYLSNVAPCLERAEALGVTLTLENEFDCFGHDPTGSDPTRRPEATLRLLERVGSRNFRLTFDPCNAYFAGLEGYLQFYNMVRHFVTYVHVKDGKRLMGEFDQKWIQFTDHGCQYATCALGDGDLDWPSLLRTLAKDGYVGFLTIEPHGRFEWRDMAWDQAASTLGKWLGAL